ncbi:MAG: hypothetical protein COX79_00585 [Candidatus Levybacteria bacterium CG_4_10_14_0_2_um_filter_36_16]|nr:MAG: hypothetical protein AUK12_03580 [Candidatus Levybacteria bacterium CG2_30_37_29]PIR79397.1 MAG: hypothetical protein COU26_01375 [Candidatus Levybacteria bacterium CG10_big_fil_rev_8_21_14_0_10_36_30]PIZ97906.1 MAG: hypothetical protein COX79_00585 [Candidatus Levybacteria bacterium CG_4_10_14_0_2_um_filter_36_16]
MNVKLSPGVLKKLKKVDVRIRNSFKERILIFTKTPRDPQLNNHKLREPYLGLRSIDITNDYRAIYEEMPKGEEIIAYFSLFGTHEELYRKGAKKGN